MKNGCNEHLEAKVAERNDRTKKVYRYVTDVSRRIGETTVACVNISDLFTTNVEVQRQKLRENCEKLLFLDPLNYGKKSLELLWRKVYYETVCTAKKLRETNNEYDGYLFSHIMSGIGHFHHIISRIECEINVRVKELDYMPSDVDDENEVVEEKFNEDELQFAKAAIFSCLIYLGDLCRYQAEIFNSFEPSIATRYYLQAAQIDLCSGMPYNQLGNLFLDKNYNLDSVCYYIHCLGSVSPFEGAIGNLTKIFEKNNQFLETINNSETCTQTEHIQKTIAEFLALTEIWYLGKEDTNVSKLCGNIAQKLKIGMDFNINPLPDINKNYVEYSQAMEEEQINPSFINSNMIHNIVEICLFTNAKLVDVDEPKAFACKAFTLAFLSQLLQKLHKHLESLGLKSPAYQYRPKLPLRQSAEESHFADIEALKTESSVILNGNKNENISCETYVHNEVSDDEEVKPINGDNKSNKKTLTKRRRRRRILSSESSDMSDADTESSEVETDKSVSGEELSDSTYASDDESKSEGSMNEDTDSEDVPVNGNADNETQIKANEDLQLPGQKAMLIPEPKINNSMCNSESKLDMDGLQNFLSGDNFLSSIKLLQDWVLTEKDLIVSCGESGESLFQCVVDLLNIFIYYFNSKTQDKVPKDECKILDYAKIMVKKLKLEYKTIPLPEDINLRGTNICKFDKDAAEWQLLEKYKPSVYEENIIRMLNFIDFGYQIAKIVPRIRFNRTLKIFYLKKLLPHKIGTKLNHKKSREWHNSKKSPESREGGLLRRLGRLWLVSQVKELERTGHTPAPSLLALDTAALYKHLKRVKQLLRTRNFIFLVPSVVLQELDELKRECSSARDAIRWLEIQLKSGSRFLKTQRPGQSKPLPLIKYPRKAPPHVHNFIQILEFCNHFIEEEKQNQGGGNGDSDNMGQGKAASLLILLVGNELGNNEEQFKEFSTTGAAQSTGISVEYIGDFYAKWRQNVIHKSGKKR
ncbi:nonsense-mediated mRNA decay factor SMG5 [Battus philenor]|uniref:nonsense-mediated mRNA decay factor SMG5 n=1 Tax=Battus philenor TaxID=42288 RepID=UPI0035CECCDB